MKDDSASTSFKERYEVPTASLPAYLRGDQKLPRDENGLVERADKRIAEGVRPVVVTQYNRIAYSAPDGSMRITADHNLMYLAVPWVANTASAMPCRIGPVIAREPGVVIEVKWFRELPRWADELYSYIKDHMVNERPSKFVVAMRHLLGEAQKTSCREHLSASALPGAAKKATSVVVVEDDPASADVLQRRLQANGMKVAVGKDGGEGLALVREIVPISSCST